MQYLMTPIEHHLDKGFGITANAYYKSAEHLTANPFEYYNVTQQAEMPQNFLYRHAIELYLKSLIVIFHKTLNIEYGTVPFDSDHPEIFSKGKWRKLYTCHYVNELYDYWLNKILLNNIEILNKLAPRGEWIETVRVTELLAIITKYDQDSAYFRYPITKNALYDNKKFTMQKFNPSQNLQSFVEEIKRQKSNTNSGSFTTLFVDDEDNIIEAFKHEENVLSDVRDALKEVAFYFNCIHAMTRDTLCRGL